MAKSWKTTWNVVGRGLNGWHAVGVAVRGSGGTLEGYLAAAVDGALVYDASGGTMLDKFAEFVFKGPMVDPALEPGAWEKFGHTGDTARALDTVGVNVYRELLRIVPGVKLGTVQGGVIVWDVQPTLPGAEHVRDQEVPQPSFELPAQSFTLTAPEESQPAQASLLAGWTMVDTSSEVAS